MFAFALYDRNRETLFLARDRLGVKPLYLRRAAGRHAALRLGTQVPAGASRRSAATIDPCAVEEYFALGYVAEPRTIFTSTRKLPPAHRLTSSGAASRCRNRSNIGTCASRSTIRSACSRTPARNSIAGCEESVRLRMISEVPLGAFLSGGVDSSAVVATMARRLERARQHLLDRLRRSGVRRDALRAAGGRALPDAPFRRARRERRFRPRRPARRASTTSRMPTARRSRPTASASSRGKHVTVALSGDGGDESFGGYRRYRMHLMEERMRSVLPLGVRQPVFGLLGRVYPKADWAPRVFRAKTTFESLARTSVEAYLHSVSIIRDAHAPPAFLAGVPRAARWLHVRATSSQRHAARAGTDDPLALIQYLDLKTYLVGDINTKVDRASMAHSLEVREPLMDHPLVEWLATLPHIAEDPGAGRQVPAQESDGAAPAARDHVPPEDGLRRAARTLVPRAVARAHAGRRARRRRSPTPASSIAASLQHLVDAHQSGARDYSAPLWTLLMFESFLRNVVYGSEGRTAARGRMTLQDPARPRSLDPAAQRLRVPDARDPARSSVRWAGRRCNSRRQQALWRRRRTRKSSTASISIARASRPAAGAALPVLDQLAVIHDTARRLERGHRSVRARFLHAHSPVPERHRRAPGGPAAGLPVVYEMRASWEDAAVDHGNHRGQPALSAVARARNLDAQARRRRHDDLRGTASGHPRARHRSRPSHGDSRTR